jgi:hypothetical protein
VLISSHKTTRAHFHRIRGLVLPDDEDDDEDECMRDRRKRDWHRSLFSDNDYYVRVDEI